MNENESIVYEIVEELRQVLTMNLQMKFPNKKLSIDTSVYSENDFEHACKCLIEEMLGND